MLWAQHGPPESYERAMSSKRVPMDFAMDIEYFERDAHREDVVAAQLADGRPVRWVT